MKRLFAFTGVAGTAVRESLERLKQHLGGNVLIVSIDELVWELFAADARKYSIIRRETELTKDQIAPNSKPNWWQFLGMPKEYIRYLWRRAAELALQQVRRSKADIVLLTFHARYQSDVYRWRFCPCDPVALRRFRIAGFFTLIDDVYNVHQRRPVDLQSERQISLRHESPFQRAESLVLQSIESLSELVHWRQEEISATEDLASACESPAHLLSIRHPLATVAKLISEPNFAYYFSHPITAIRRDPKFPHNEDLREILSISAQLRMQTTLIEPTAIDEFRFDTIEREGEKLFLPSLSPRWPYAGTPDELLGPPAVFGVAEQQQFICPQDNIAATDLTQVFAEMAQRHGGQTERTALRTISEAVKRFADLIGEDITWRDHALVDQCQRMIVFRPAYRGVPSIGVRRELEYQRKLSLSAVLLTEAPRGNTRGCFIYHPPNDETELNRYVAAQIVKEWAVDSSIKMHLRPPLRPESEKKLLDELTEILSAGLEASVSAARCAEQMRLRVLPAVMDPTPMQKGRRSGVQDRNQEVLAKLRESAEKQIRKYRYLPALVEDRRLGLCLVVDGARLVRAVRSRHRAVRSRP